MLTLNDGRNELWQWDTGGKLTVDADCSQVHFSNKVFGRSIDVDVVDGVAIIPDILLQTDKDLTAWAFVGTAENGYTKISKVFKVNKRNKPADYVFTPPEQTTLGQIMKRLDRIEESQDPDAIKNAVEDYLEKNPVTPEGIGAVSDEDPLLRYDEQNLTPEQQARARANIGVADAFEYATYGLPVLALTGDTSAMTKDNAVNMQYAFQDRSGNCEVKWQGGSSLSYPKKNYTIKFDTAFEAVEGWGEQKKYCAKANFIDHSHARNVVSAKLWGALVRSRPDGSDNLFDPSKTSYGFVTDNGDALTGENPDWIHTELLALPEGVRTLYFFNSGFKEYLQVRLSCYDGSQSGLTTLSFQESNCLSCSFDVPDGTKYVRLSYSGIVNGAVVSRNDIYLGANPNAESYVGVTSKLLGLPNGGAIDGFPIIITHNGVFHGLYTLNIPKDGWMFGMNDTTAQQAIVCADAHTDVTRFHSSNVQLDGNDFELEYVSDEGNADWVKSSIQEMINTIHFTIDYNHPEEIVTCNHLDIWSAIDYYIFACLLNGYDITDKNYILATFDGVKWFFSAYDLDSTWGLQWDGKSFNSPKDGVTINNYAGMHYLMDYIRKYKKSELKARYAYIRESIMGEDDVALAFLGFTKDIPSTLFAEDAKKWPTIPSTAVSNVNQILNWYRLRCLTIDAEIEAL